MNPTAGTVLVAGVWLGGGLLTPRIASAAQWRFDPSLQLQAIDESNPRLLPGGSPDAQGMLAGMDVSLSRATERTTLALLASAADRRYQQESGLDRLDANSTLLLQTVSERWSWQVKAEATRDTTLTSELGTTGASDAKDRHEAAAGSADMGWVASERMSLGVGVSTQFNFYPDQGVTLFDYRYRSVHFDTSYALGQRSALALTAQRGELTVSGSDYRSTDSSLLLEYRFKPDERFSLSIAAGPSRVAGPRSAENGRSYSTTLTTSAERFSATLTGGRRIAPTGRGYLTRRDEASLGMSVRLVEHVDGSVTGTYIRSKDILATLGLAFSDIRYGHAGASVAWQFRQDWSLGLTSGYARQSGNGPGLARGLDAGVSIRWNGSGYAW